MSVDETSMLHSEVRLCFSSMYHRSQMFVLVWSRHVFVAHCYLRMCGEILFESWYVMLAGVRMVSGSLPDDHKHATCHKAFGSNSFASNYSVKFFDCLRYLTSMMLCSLSQNLVLNIVHLCQWLQCLIEKRIGVNPHGEESFISKRFWRFLMEMHW